MPINLPKNSNYIPLFITLYFYSIGICIGGIILLNNYDFSVLYDVL